MGLSVEEEKYISDIEAQNEQLSRMLEQQPAYPTGAPTMFAGQAKQNLVEWQLDFRPELADIEHLLRSDVIKRDERGREYWDRNPNKTIVVLNELGVNDMLREIRMFLNKNQVLSNYDKEEIRQRVRMLGHELRALIYNNAERYGIDNEYKENNYPILVLTILNMIDASYRRSINGEERRDLNSARVVNQTDPIMQHNPYAMMGMPQQPKKGFISKMMPWNWGKS